ncbi:MULTISPECIES: enoyl-CoA hydratase/isomerase family protein [Pseudonocardia]|uniref:1,2-epoxyphenylacetyl-CoA isomerase n=2 Tax=Pseudonocardia TaxID=1847 RepID=A0A1Y2MY51_PSEAH|nr:MULTISPECIES: enoyl-CoA hydratase-related protein [Pseudonocardia]OSY40095.1 1,2-epoxyphenylacetyl-CoA isomerase [Pseudonocardia autotrophica]TDN72959.1 2-(1,2-epoxy-1,2-dihydrophenyl)acetyl-CoA isomerase [Pseudonocardia autotrophica]BBG03679.1 putative enoyl-CoA hydratase/isomerase [Pseudonocardia autotrophica]GEC29200.1 putative enoyl-CoA hydratase/isomerase [Pseudonocardia saturnea]
MSDPVQPAVLVARDDTDPAVAVVTLNRPAKYNALTVELKEALLTAVAEVTGDESVRAVVITGSGKAFCVGQDLGEHATALENDPSTAFDTVREHYNPLILAITGTAKPVIAAINGACVGAGLGLALAADLRVAAEGLSFATAFTGIGLTADSGLSASLAHAVGVSRATELLLLGEKFTAEDARNWGLVRDVVPAEDVLPAALGLARRLAAGPTRAYAEVKTAIRFGAVNELPAVLEHEADAQARLAGTTDHQRAVADFLAKKAPTFEGR